MTEAEEVWPWAHISQEDNSLIEEWNRERTLMNRRRVEGIQGEETMAMLTGEKRTIITVAEAEGIMIMVVEVEEIIMKVIEMRENTTKVVEKGGNTTDVEETIGKAAVVEDMTMKVAEKKGSTMKGVERGEVVKEEGTTGKK